MLQDIGQVRLASHSDVEPDDRRAGGTEHGRIGWLFPVVAPAIEFILEDSAWPCEREQHPVGLAIANLDSLDVERELHRVRQHELVGDVEAPVGAPHGLRVGEERGREPSELWGAIDPRHTGAGVSRSPRLRRTRYCRHRNQRQRHARNGGGTAKLGRHPCPSLSGHAGIARLQANLHPAVRRPQDCDRITCDANSILLLSRESRSGGDAPFRLPGLSSTRRTAGRRPAGRGP